MAERGFALPAAIVVAGAFIGAGLFFGLRDRAGAPLPGHATSSAVASPPASPVLPPLPGAERREPAPPAPGVSAVAPGKVAQQAAAGLDAQRARLTAKCAPPTPVKFLFSFTFDAEGNQLSRGVTEERGKGQPAVTQCVLQTLTSITVPAPGTTTVVEVPFTLP